MTGQDGAWDLYKVLGVARDASQADLKKAYRQLAQQYHPDKCPGDKGAEDKFKEAANAYHILSDADKRAAYDRQGMDGIRHSGGVGGAGGAGSGGFESVEAIFTAFGDLFGDFFSGRMRDRQAARGADLRIELSLKFHEAVWGTHKDVKITRSVGCATCGATGNASGGKAEACRQCQGRGQVVHAQGFFMVQTTCSMCGGGGKTVKDPCGDCRGRGFKSEVSTLALVIPPGMGDGQMLRLSGKGENSIGGISGDLYVVLRVGEDARFRREGADVISEVSISFAKAVLGGEIEITTLDSNCEGAAILELGPGTQPGDVVFRRGQGIPQHGRGSRGDHRVTFKIAVPKKLSSTQEKLLREYAAACGEEGSKRSKRKGR